MQLTSILWVLSGMYQKWPLWGQNRSIYRIPSIENFCWIQLELHLQAHWSYYWRYVKYKPRGSNFRSIWDLQMSKNSSFRIYCWKVSSVFTSVFLYVLIAAQRPYFWAILGPKASQNSYAWSLSQNVFIGFTSIKLHMLIPLTFKCVENMGLRGPIFGPFWALR